MTSLDQHIIFQLSSLSEDGKEHARKVLGKVKVKKLNEKDAIMKDKFNQLLMRIKIKNSQI